VQSAAVGSAIAYPEVSNSPCFVGRFWWGLLVRYEQMFALMDEIKQAREALDAQAAAWVAVVGEYDRSEQWRADGYGSVEGAIADLCRMDRGAVSVDVKLARKLEKLAVVAEAFAEGSISQRHASVIVTAATPARMAEFTNLEERFVDVARKCPPKELADVVRYVTDALDGDGGADAEEKIYQRRRYHQSRTLDDMLATNGLFDPESAKLAESALKTARALTNVTPKRAPPGSGTRTRSR
jgi:hypothetical protein